MAGLKHSFRETPQSLILTQLQDPIHLSFILQTSVNPFFHPVLSDVLIHIGRNDIDLIDHYGGALNLVLRFGSLVILEETSLKFYTKLF